MAENTNLVKYGSYELDDAEHDKAELAGGGNKHAKIKVGENVFRFLPPLPGKKVFKITSRHAVTPPGGDTVYFDCPRRVANRPCPICEKANQLANSGNPLDAERAKGLWPSRRVYANVIDRSDEDAGPKVLPLTKTSHEELIALREDPDCGGDFTNPVTGYDIKITREGTGKKDTRYKVRPRKVSPLGTDAQINAWIEAQHNLDAEITIMTPEEIKAKLSGEDDAPAAKQPGRGRVVDADEPRQPKGRTVADAGGQAPQDDDFPY
jgi:hypothetical protein